ncbi:NAD(P)-dependent oxidoreductase [Saccharothrix obliqua]|uniref:NAD(P)-dependent oxidoreductase n=1 Tax=Saccharothrix obliqua TaxID=2861747 RepID=UPI001C5FBC13|nr:NAD(P)-binding domain-containing protein [Saccharothrix obliqua]MBW4721742.1 NAD(P)-dependent oxidoreductase [Saccharothrix obliqua]
MTSERVISGRVPTGRTKQPVTVLGLGSMGTALAAAFRRAGHPTTTWTRSHRRGPAGTADAATAAAAVAASPLVAVCVLDYQAVDAVLAGELTGKAVVNLTTGTPEQARVLAARVVERGGEYLDGGILVTPPAIGSPTATVLYSGSPDAFQANDRVLTALGAARYLGADPGLAALYDAALLGIAYSTVTGFLQAAALVGREEVSAARFLPYAREVLATTSASLTAVARRVDSGEHTGLDARLDVRLSAVEHLVHAGQVRGIDTTILEHVRALLAQAVADGHGAADYSAVIELLREP